MCNVFGDLKMPKFSEASRLLLCQCHPDLQIIADTAIKFFDFTILDSTIRTNEQQEQFFKEGKSKTLNSKHLKKYFEDYNKDYSRAFDFAPYPIKWEDRERFCYLAGVFLGIAEILYNRNEIKHMIRWGGDWDNDRTTKDESFSDIPHIELIED